MNEQMILDTPETPLPPECCIQLEGLAAIPVATMEDDQLLLEGVYEDAISFQKQVFPKDKPFIVDGQGKTELKGGLVIMDCHNMVFRNFKVTGGQMAGINLNDSYPEYGLKNITIENVIVDGAGPRGIFLGAYNVDGIFIKHCNIRRVLGGTHGIYMSGGNWKPEYHCENIFIDDTLVEVGPGARNCIQFNIRLRNGAIRNCKMRHFEMNAFTLYGCKDFFIEENEAYGCNRGPGGIGDYASSWGPYYNFFQTQEDIEEFNETHWPCENIMIRNNTFLVGPHQFSKDLGHNNDPTKNYPALWFNNGIHSGFTIWRPDLGEHVEHEGWEYPWKNIYLWNNVLWSPNLNLLDILHDHEAQQIDLARNIFYSTKKGVPFIGGSRKLKGLKDCIIADPEFLEDPKYKFIDLIENPEEDFKDYKSKFDGFSWLAKQRGAGKTYKIGGVWAR